MSEYEYSVPLSIGGAAATYTLTSPWGPTPCEYSVRAVSASGAGGLCVSYDSMSVNGVTATNTTGGFRGELYNFSAATPAPMTPSALFAACPNGQLVLTVTGASNIVAVVHFRRALGVAHLPPLGVYHINPDLTPEEAVHAQRARDLAAYDANPAKSEGA